MYTRTLAQLRTSLLIRGSWERSADITPAVCLEVLNDAIEETFNIIQACDDDYYVRLGASFALVIGTDTYALPTDFYNLRKVEIQVDSTRWQKLLPVPLDGNQRITQFGLTGKRYRYRLSNLGLTFYPIPASTDNVRIYYIPLAPQLAVDSDVVVFDRPVEQKLVLLIAYRDCLQRQDLDTSATDGKIAQLSQQLRAAADSHDDGEPFYLSRSGPYGGDGDDGGVY